VYRHQYPEFGLSLKFMEILVAGVEISPSNIKVKYLEKRCILLQK
jgi:hypothetical protein